MKRLTDTACVFRIHLARLRAEAGPFVLAALLFPAAMYLFANAVGGAQVSPDARLRFLAPVYYTPETLPRALRVVAEWLPTSFAARAVGTSLAGGTHVGTELLALALMAAATLSVGFRLMRWREE